MIEGLLLCGDRCPCALVQSSRIAKQTSSVTLDKYKDPVTRLHLALLGHPNSGGSRSNREKPNVMNISNDEHNKILTNMHAHGAPSALRRRMARNITKIEKVCRIISTKIRLKPTRKH